VGAVRRDSPAALNFFLPPKPSRVWGLWTAGAKVKKFFKNFLRLSHPLNKFVFTDFQGKTRANWLEYWAWI
jgi:hypothetical protein